MKKIIPAILFLAVLGMIISVLMIQIHYQLSVDPDKKSFCHISGTIDCDAVLASPYAKLGPFFNAELSFNYYLLIIAGIFTAWSAKKRLPILAGLFLLTLFYAVYGLVIGSIPIVKLGVACPLGLIIAMINLAILVLLPTAMKVPLRELPLTLKRKLIGAPKTLLTYLIVASMIFGMGFAFSRKLNPQAQYSFGFSPEVYLKSFYALPQKQIPLPERPIRGNPNAPVTILVVSDFQCPACRLAYDALKPIVGQYGDHIRQIYLNYPLNSSCNSAVGSAKYPLSCVASQAALCAPIKKENFGNIMIWYFNVRVQPTNP